MAGKADRTHPQFRNDIKNEIDALESRISEIATNAANLNSEDHAAHYVYKELERIRERLATLKRVDPRFRR
jgi:hypothetical protein